MNTYDLIDKVCKRGYLLYATCSTDLTPTKRGVERRYTISPPDPSSPHHRLFRGVLTIETIIPE